MIAPLPFRLVYPLQGHPSRFVARFEISGRHRKRLSHDELAGYLRLDIDRIDGVKTEGNVVSEDGPTDSIRRLGVVLTAFLDAKQLTLSCHAIAAAWNYYFVVQRTIDLEDRALLMKMLADMGHSFGVAMRTRRIAQEKLQESHLWSDASHEVAEQDIRLVDQYWPDVRDAA